ncbi:carboxymuconolactone decarboxylase family protein [Mycobacterium genavense]|uniref:carboxymuconolactone decarboxylase family protein n=1 Tax=Mycobacterium genavense TaxID=36812 RepID=UPI001FE05576|nr:carboxymuconolactone decarboxylase family protein [Mycobacterium genavense]
MARLDVPEGPGGEAAMIWTLRPQLGGMVETMILGAYQQSILPADERELARMRIAQINDCVACSGFRAQSVLDAGVAPELYDNVAAYADYPGYPPASGLPSSTPNASPTTTRRWMTRSSDDFEHRFPTTRFWT